jgi:hypothetical protein
MMKSHRTTIFFAIKVAFHDEITSNNAMATMQRYKYQTQTTVKNSFMWSLRLATSNKIHTIFSD